MSASASAFCLASSEVISNGRNLDDDFASGALTERVRESLGHVLERDHRVNWHLQSSTGDAVHEVFKIGAVTEEDEGSPSHPQPFRV